MEIESTAIEEQASQVKAEPPEQPEAPPKPEKPKQTFKCLVCGKSYSKKTSLFTHHKTHPDFCVHCGENRGSSADNIYQHNLKHINIRPFICKLCGDSFLRNQQFVEHEKSHDKPPEEPVIKESKYKCKTCQESFSNWKLFYKHQQESGHFNEKFLCEICGSEFHSNFLLSQHIRRMHKRTDESFPCTSCSKVFATKPNLDSHIKKIHQNDNKKFVCEVCNNSFSSAPNLKQHIKTVHDVEKEYECQTCKKPFKAKNRLTRHEKEVHMGKNGNPDEVRMFNCDHCQKKYKRSWHQARHSQMKHENSNCSTATTSSTGTPPTPEINGNLPNASVPVPGGMPGNMLNNNNNFNYHQQQLQQVPQMPSQPLTHDMNAQHHHQQQQQQPNMSIPPAQNSWDQHMSPQGQPQHHLNYGSGSEMMTPTPPMNQQSPVAPNGEYVNYAVNEQYSNKFEQIQSTPSTVTPVPSGSYESWNSQPAQTWDYNQQHHMQQPMYQHHQQPTEWYGYDPNQPQAQQHEMYHNSYNNYKTDYNNCLNNQPIASPAPIHHQPPHTPDPSLYNGYYYPQTPAAYGSAQQPQQPQQLNQHPNYPDYQHSNYHQNYHSSM